MTTVKTVKIIAVSRDEAETMEPEESYAVISITNPDWPLADLPRSGYLRGVLSVQFWDVEEKNGPCQPIRASQARKIARFAVQHLGNVSLMVCHCEAGVSRSAGVAAAISRWYYGDAAGDSFFDLTRHSPNRLVHDMVLKVLRDIDKGNKPAEGKPKKQQKLNK